jgi:hypothetical protein
VQQQLGVELLLGLGLELELRELQAEVQGGQTELDGAFGGSGSISPQA